MAILDFTRFFDLVKATGWQAAAVALGCFIFLVFASMGSFDLPSKWIAPIVTLVMLVSAALALMALLAALGRWLAKVVPKWSEFFNEGRNIKQAIRLLNQQEKDVLEPHLKANEQSFYLSPFTQRGGIPEALRLQAIYTGLADKGIITMTATDSQGKNVAIHITKRAWKLLKQ